MFGRVMLGGFLRVVLSLQVMAVRYVCVMTGFLVVARFVMIGGKPMVLRGVFVLFGCLAVMIGGVFRHGILCCLELMQGAVISILLPHYMQMTERCEVIRPNLYTTVALLALRAGF